MATQEEIEKYNTFDAPQAMLDTGFIRLPHAAGFGLRPEQYLIKLLPAWEDACNLADKIKLITEGRIWWLFSEMKNVLRNAAEAPADERDHLVRVGVESVWVDFCSATTHFRPYGFATEMIKLHRVFRVPLSTDLAENDPKRDPGGFVAEATGAGGVMNYYRGRESHVMRLGLCCAFASVGSYFSGA